QHGDIVDNLLRYDALTADGGQNRPDFLNWNNEKYQERTAAFWRDRLPNGYGASALIDDYRFTNWRELNKKYHIEVFDFSVGDEVILARKQALLFIYSNHVLARVIEVDSLNSIT
ncbi:MAG: DUF4080 domain-containing protein, partial [Anaerovibrio sp.]|uniref:DUF4080 domain-containing protein n=1 Tax=Anaerovibrio sp. TaxID=1872532 RepID=UPI0025F9A8D8